MILFYDFEVTKFDWLVTIIDPINQKEYYFENDQPALVDFYENDRVVEYEINVKEEKQKYAWSNMIKAFNDLAETIS